MPTFPHGQRLHFPKRRSKCSHILPLKLSAALPLLYLTLHLVSPSSPWQAGLAQASPLQEDTVTALFSVQVSYPTLEPHSVLQRFHLRLSPLSDGEDGERVPREPGVFCLGPYRVLLFGECC